MYFEKAIMIHRVKTSSSIKAAIAVCGVFNNPVGIVMKYLSAASAIKKNELVEERIRQATNKKLLSHISMVTHNGTKAM